MKKTAKNELRAKSAADLAAEVQRLRESMLKARIAGSMEGKTRGMQYRVARRQIARIQTILGEQSAKAGKK